MFRDVCFMKNNMGISMKNTQSADFCADQIDFITNFAVITNVVIKKVQCISLSFFKINIVFELLK